ncbi:MAG TPA: hypothetical protein VMW42_07825, partial [Desulfatiglandales bacterium]|nr:hypothetical protein [Desulfatiglandales bacterium]
PRFQRHFENAVQRAEKFTSRINQNAKKIQILVDELRRAGAENNRERVTRLREQLQKDIQQFKDTVGRFRRAMNRVRAMGQLSHRVEGFFEKNRDKYSNQDIAMIRPSLMAIADKRAQLKDIFKATVSNIKKTFRELKALKQESRSPRGQ